MFCSRCGNNLKEGQIFCPKCGVKLDSLTNPVSGSQSIISFENSPLRKESGIMIFWVSIILGTLGIHCFMSHRKIRGFIYLLFGGVVYVMIKAFFYGLNGEESNSIIDVFAIGFGVIILFLNFLDSWKISNGTYKNKKTGYFYVGNIWMKIITIIVFIFAFLLKLIGGVSVVTDYLNEKTKQADMKLLQAYISTYIKLQNSYFSEVGDAGSALQIGYSFNNTKYFDLVEIDTRNYKGMFIKNKIQIKKCPAGNLWEISSKKNHRKLFWIVQKPFDQACSSIEETFDEYLEYVTKNNPKEPTLEELRTEAMADYQDFLTFLKVDANYSEMSYDNLMEYARKYLLIADFISNQGATYLNKENIIELKKQLVKKQSTEFPKLRKEYGKKLDVIVWEEDMDVRTYGNGNTIIQGISFKFASNFGIKEFNDRFMTDLNSLRFKKIIYMPYDGAIQYSYSTLQVPADKDIVKSDNAIIE